MHVYYVWKMGRKSDLSNAEKSKIIDLLGQRATTLQISKILKRDHRTIKSYVRNSQKHRKPRKQAKFRNFSNRDLSRIKRELAKNPLSNSKKIFEACGYIGVPKTTRCKLLRNVGKIKKLRSVIKFEEMNETVTHKGGCHCGAVRFEVKAPAELYVYDCNCSICKKKQNRHFVVPHENFKLLQGEDQLTTYSFNTHKAKHTFCKICGVQSFYQPRSNPNGYGVMPHCLDPGTVTKVTVESFDGEKWEESMQDQAQRPKESSILQWA